LYAKPEININRRVIRGYVELVWRGDGSIIVLSLAACRNVMTQHPAESSFHDTPGLAAPTDRRKTMKGRLLFTSAFFAFVQIPAQAQVTVDVSKITCEEYLTDTITASQYVVIWLSGYYNGKRNNTIIEPDAIKRNEQKVGQYCYEHRDTTVMDAVKSVLGVDK
jgi:hypothetical protein